MELTQHCSSPVIHAVQYDQYSREVELRLLENGTPWIIPEDAIVLIRYRRADGKGGIYSTLPDERPAWTASENILTLALAPQVLTTPGAVSLGVTLMREETRISTFSMILHVNGAVHTGTGESGDHFHVPSLLPAPETARPAQYLQVSAVDSAGHVTAVRAVNLNSQTKALTEPGDGDIPKVFFGKALPQAKTDALMSFRYISRTEDISGYCKTKAQGSSSMNYPKKNQTVKLYKDAACSEALKIDFLDWGPQSKFCFKANWVDHSHARNIVCARLWSEVVSSRRDYEELPAGLRSSPNNGAVDGFPVKVYAEGEYQGIYTLNIPKDRWMFHMDDEDPNHLVLCAETNTNGTFEETPCNFRALWDGVHENHWSVEVGSNSEAVQNSLNALISCVKDTDDDVFPEAIHSFLDIQSAMDYYIFQYVIYGIDGLAKNMLLYTYDGAKWFCGTYDMDTVFGASSVNDYFFPHDRRVPEDCAEAYSLLWSRIEELFTEELKARYVELRRGVLSVSNIINKFERFTDVISKDLYTEDGSVFPDIPSLTTNNIQQIRAYTLKRLEYCDTQFSLMGAQAAYIESHGAEHIDTGISGGAHASYEMKMAICPDNVDWTWFTYGGTAFSGYDAHLSLYTQGGNILTGLPCNDIWLVSAADYSDKVVTWDGSSGTLKYGSTTKITNHADVPGLGWGSSTFKVLGGRMKLYNLKMHTDGALVRNFIPMYHIVRDEFGLYDQVSGKYFSNATGTGGFTGALVEVHKETYTQVSYIESRDSGSINTGVSGGINAAYEMKMALQEGNGDWKWFASGGVTFSGYEAHLSMYSVSGNLMTGLPVDNIWLASLTDYGDKLVTWDGTTGTLKYGSVTRVTNHADVPGLGWGNGSFQILGGCMKLYYLKMYTDGTLVRDFIPAKRSSDGTYGLLDQLTGTFYTSSTPLFGPED